MVSKKNIIHYLETFNPDVVLFVETPFSPELLRQAGERNVKTVGIPMHESKASQNLRPDLLVCPCYEAYRKARHPHKLLMFLPIGLEMFPYRQRTGHVFVHNLGYGGLHNRRQTDRVVEAFVGIPDKDARLILRTQADAWPPDTVVNDSRITYQKKNFLLPRDIYADGDIAIAPQAYGGYERSILEAMASGLPTLTTDADPMNLFQHNPEFLLPVASTHVFTDKWVVMTTYNEVSVEALRAKMEWLLTIDTAAYSEEARRQAVAQSWECEEIPYRETWMEMLAELVG
jgi:hypothetical protein